MECHMHMTQQCPNWNWYQLKSRTAIMPWIPGLCEFIVSDSQALFYWFESGLGPKFLGMFFFHMRLGFGQSSIGTCCQPS